MSSGKEREGGLREDPLAAESPQVESFSARGRAAILDLLVTIGDNKYRLGRRYSEWATAAPTLEASVAAASMTSDELGHARSLYPLLRQFPGAPPELKREEDRTEFRSVSFLDEPFGAWTDLVAACVLFGRALDTAVAALRDSAYAPFRHRAAKILQEERYHRLYGDGWLEVLAAEEAPRASLSESLRRIWTESAAWFGPDDDPVLEAAAEEGITDGDARALRARFLASAAEPLGQAPGLNLPADPAIPWERWDPVRRRLRPA